METYDGFWLERKIILCHYDFRRKGVIMITSQKNKNNNLKVISLRLRPDTAKKLKILATIDGLSMNRVLSEFVDHYINENHDRAALKFRHQVFTFNLRACIAMNHQNRRCSEF